MEKLDYWKDIGGYEGLYMISFCGLVRSLDRICKNRSGGISRGRILKPGVNKRGYLRVGLSKNGKPKIQKVHRLVGINHIPNPYNYPEINHLNGVKDCNCVPNLEWTTSSKNTRHAFGIGLQVPVKGEQHGRSKLKEKQVVEIKQKLKQGIRGIDLVKEYGVSHSTISNIRKNKSWRHVC